MQAAPTIPDARPATSSLRRKVAAYVALTKPRVIELLLVVTAPTMILAAVLVGITLKRLLLFYPGRAEAQRAATKFALVWHAGDAMLVPQLLPAWSF